jgi:hypothetical protein
LPKRVRREMLLISKEVFMSRAALLNITGVDTAYNKQSEIHHYSHFSEDISGTPTPDAYLELARQLARSAALDVPGTHIKERGNGDMAIYVDTPLSRAHSHHEGIYLVVRDRGSHGLLATMFAPTKGKAYFDADDRMLI